MNSSIRTMPHNRLDRLARYFRARQARLAAEGSVYAVSDLETVLAIVAEAQAGDMLALLRASSLERGVMMSPTGRAALESA